MNIISLRRQLVAIFLILLIASVPSYAAKDYLDGEGEDGAGPVAGQAPILSSAYVYGRLSAIGEILKSKHTPEEQASLLCEKADLFLVYIRPTFSLKNARECVVEALRVDPDNKIAADLMSDIVDYEMCAPTEAKYEIDLDGDGIKQRVNVTYGTGVSDKTLTIEVYKGDEVISTLTGRFGIQSNYKIEDIDADDKQEIIIWSGLWDFRLPGEDGVTEETYEGHSAQHRYVVATYKLVRGQYYLWDIYTTKEKYEPFCEEQPK